MVNIFMEIFLRHDINIPPTIVVQCTLYKKSFENINSMVGAIKIALALYHVVGNSIC